MQAWGATTPVVHGMMLAGNEMMHAGPSDTLLPGEPRRPDPSPDVTPQKLVRTLPPDAPSMPAISESISIRAYAKHRGVSDTAVRKALKAGRIQLDTDGKINIAAADLAWDDTASARVRTSGCEPANLEGANPGSGSHPARGANREPTAAASGGGEGTLADAQRRKELALAQMREHELGKMRGEFVTLDFMVEQLEGALFATRDVMLQLPGILAPRLAGLQREFRDGLDAARARLTEAGDAAGLAVLDEVAALDSEIVARAQRMLDDAVQDALPRLAAVADALDAADADVEEEDDDDARGGEA